MCNDYIPGYIHAIFTIYFMKNKTLIISIYYFFVTKIQQKPVVSLKFNLIKKLTLLPNFKMAKLKCENRDESGQITNLTFKKKWDENRV